MEDMLLETDKAMIPHELAELLRDHNGADTLVLDLREMGAWTDFFVITTATSDTHLDGLERHVKEFCVEREIAILRRSRRPNVSHRTPASYGSQSSEDEWRIIDLGPIVIHLMSGKARAFYDLERLYSWRPDHSRVVGSP
ncbi:MAG: ribosome silencing factor [Treponema sp.]|nr:ribosome silencing factor [Treponema sp.]